MLSLVEEEWDTVPKKGAATWVPPKMTVKIFANETEFKNFNLTEFKNRIQKLKPNKRKRLDTE